VTSCLRKSVVRTGDGGTRSSSLHNARSVLELLENARFSGKLSGMCTRNDCSAQFANSSFVLVAYPLYAMISTIILAAPSRLGSCSDLIIDASSSLGSAGRAWTSVSFSVFSAVSYSAISVEKYLLQFSSSVAISHPIVVPQSYLNSTSYIFRLTLSIFLGMSASGLVSVNVTGAASNSSIDFGIQAYIQGPNFRTIAAQDPLKLLAIVMVPSCVKSSYTFSYSFSVFKNYIRQKGLSSTSRNPTKFRLGSYSLAHYRY
jgi:hypothetical protein